jgi:hypothetical protein
MQNPSWSHRELHVKKTSPAVRTTLTTDTPKRLHLGILAHVAAMTLSHVPAIDKL